MVANDAGYTKADMNQTQRSFFCVHFARGACALGAECRYYHRVPTAEDDACVHAALPPCLPCRLVLTTYSPQRT